MKLTLMSALLISGALSATTNDAGLEARGTPTTCCCVVPVNDHDTLEIVDYVPKGHGYIQRNSEVYDKMNFLQGHCNIGFDRNDDCTKWRQSTTTTDGPCDGKIHKARCFDGI